MVLLQTPQRNDAPAALTQGSVELVVPPLEPTEAVREQHGERQRVDLVLALPHTRVKIEVVGIMVRVVL